MSLDDTVALRIADVPVKLLRKFCSEQRLGVRHLSTRTKDMLLAEIFQRTGAEEKLRAWLAASEASLDYKVESLKDGRRITRTYADGYKRIFLSKGEDIFIAKEGDIVDRRYKIVHIGQSSVDVEDVLTNNRQTLPLQAG